MLFVINPHVFLLGLTRFMILAAVRLFCFGPIYATFGVSRPQETISAPLEPSSNGQALAPGRRHFVPVAVG